jgi:outer membrane lipoprotein-sorting protein
MAADIAQPAAKYVLFSGGEVKMLNPKIDTVTTYKVGKNRGEIESFLVLGFGGRGHDLAKSYDVKYLGTEKLGNVETAKLELVPKSEKTRAKFSKILLWIDPARGISLQQQLYQSGGDFRLAKYSEVQMNHKLPDGVFKLKTTSKTQYLAPQG